MTTSLCPTCVAEGRDEEMVVPMVVYEEDGEIRLAKSCPDHGEVRDVYWSEAEMFYRAQEWSDDGDHLDTAHVTPAEGGITCPIICPIE